MARSPFPAASYDFEHDAKIWSSAASNAPQIRAYGGKETAAGFEFGRSIHR
jgi:hypothetical protein